MRTVKWNEKFSAIIHQIRRMHSCITIKKKDWKKSLVEVDEKWEDDPTFSAVNEVVSKLGLT